MITINALAASDEVLIPVEASYLPIKGLQQLLKTIVKVRKQINPKLQVGGILFTMVDAHTNDARNNMELLRNVYGSPVSYTHLTTISNVAWVINHRSIPP